MALLRQPMLWVSVGFAVAALRALTASSTTAAGKWVGASLVFGGALLVIAGLYDRFVTAAALGIASIVGGSFLFVDQEAYSIPVARATMVLLGIAGVAAAVAVKRAGFNYWVSSITLVIFAGSGWLFAAYYRELMTLGFGSIGLALATTTAAGTVIANRSTASVVGLREAWTSFGSEVLRRVGGQAKFDPEVQEASAVLDDMVFFEGDRRTNQLVRFYALMAFASALASLGVLSDSTAVVIGAMLVAPLMAPLMGISLAVVSGWRTRLVANVAIAGIGICIPIIIGVVASAMIGMGVDPDTNTQIVSRATPTLIDLAIALAAGAAGAYALSRRDIADSLPGVAVAIALVPPLTVVGIAAQLGDMTASRGALVLFLTNVFAIIGMGAVVFLLTGVAGWAGTSPESVGNWVATFGLAGFAVVALLVANQSAANSSGYRTDAATGVVQAWAADNEYDVDRVIADGDVVTVIVFGTEVPDESASTTLSEGIAEYLGDVQIDLRVRLEARQLIESSET